MDPSQQEQVQHFSHIFAAMMPVFFLIGLVIVAIYIIPLWKICTKAGLAGPLSLIALIPGIGKLITLYIIAFSDWKVTPTSALPFAPPAYPPPAAYPPQATATTSAFPPTYPPTTPPSTL